MSGKAKAIIVAQDTRLNRPLLWAAGVVVVLLLTVGAWGLLQRDEMTTFKVPQLSGDALSAAVNKKLGAYDYLGAVQLLKGQKTAEQPATQLLLANVYASQKNYSAALAIYAALQKAGKLSSQSAAAAGAIAEQGGDTKTALSYYQTAVQKAGTKQRPANDDELHMYQAKVVELQQKL